MDKKLKSFLATPWASRTLLLGTKDTLPHKEELLWLNEDELIIEL